MASMKEAVDTLVDALYSHASIAADRGNGLSATGQAATAALTIAQALDKLGVVAGPGVTS